VRLLASRPSPHEYASAKISPQNLRSTNYKSVGKSLLLVYARLSKAAIKRIAKHDEVDDRVPIVIAND
jgi:hypothetical protein